MKISICMPVMGNPQSFFEAICSILVQGYEDVELVVQDGGPGDPVVGDPRVEKVMALFGKGVYSVGRDGGIFPALNMCLRRATGDILYFMCGDDLLCPGALAAVNKAFEAERFGGPHWLYGKTVSADETGRSLGIDGEPTTYAEMLVHNRLGQPAVFWNRHMMELAGLFDTRYRWAADYEMWLRFWRRWEPEFLNQELGVFRHHGDNSSKVHAAELEAECVKIKARYSSLGDVIIRAHNRQTALHAYGRDIPIGRE